ncbi:putative beta-lysine N-acetyltransferase [Alkaliphilus serpentinus]|uniref:Putative beta-lysine N-acetyltransferase n=1 Tax=Alkaliphilus serpentinus TaxID=1482731 RepID=A0A833HPE6_9FIRM|nr:putative beta-lysine N-acetyltransferase [Alkaliphilus serpentinus]KAB3530709.1 putative beta-lysine N-acetyltransferase [Alkaliphilus serpentinus]
MTLLKNKMIETNNEHIIVDEPNKRVIFYQYEADLLQKRLEEVEAMKDKNIVDKVSLYATEENLQEIEEVAEATEMNLKFEGKIDGYFDGEDAFIYSQFLDPTREVCKHKQQQEKIISSAIKKGSIDEIPQLQEEFDLRAARHRDVIEMADVFRQVFKTYPTPMHEPKYIKKVMDDNTIFTLVTYEDKIVSIASADINSKYNNAEITDCATLPEFRGNGLLTHIIANLEERLIEREVPNLFSLTRAQSIGMNHVIAKHGYDYRGTLVQNCDISGSFEDMNIWVKQLEL